MRFFFRITVEWLDNENKWNERVIVVYQIFCMNMAGSKTYHWVDLANFVPLKYGRFFLIWFEFHSIKLNEKHLHLCINVCTLYFSINNDIIRCPLLVSVLFWVQFIVFISGIAFISNERVLGDHVHMLMHA